MMNWAEYEEQERKHERSHVRRIMVGILAGGAVALGAMLWAKNASAEARFAASQGSTTVTLFDEPCELKDQISNMPYKATWTENGKTFQGCWTARPDAEVVLAYFDDHTVAMIPFQALQKTTGV